MRWADLGHYGEKKGAYKVLMGNPGEKRPLGGLGLGTVGRII